MASRNLSNACLYKAYAFSYSALLSASIASLIMPTAWDRNALVPSPDTIPVDVALVVLISLCGSMNFLMSSARFMYPATRSSIAFFVIGFFSSVVCCGERDDNTEVKKKAKQTYT